MNIVIYNIRMEDAEKAFVKVRDEILEGFKSIMSCPHRGVIDIGPFIRISFRCGDPHKMSGLVCKYYAPEVEPWLEYAAARCNGRELTSLEEIRDVVIECLTR